MPLIMTVLAAFLTSFSTGEGDGVWVCGCVSGGWGWGVTHKCSHLICLKKQEESEQNRHVSARTSVRLSICGTNAKIFGSSTQKVNFFWQIYYIYCVPLTNYIDIIFFTWNVIHCIKNTAFTQGLAPGE